ncbi:MAG: efflux RND transporter permease subunit, partial [Spirochaetes bacterium]|nr:efflux RND transporter permease subunit [Spirochaetota bacterium]
PICKISLEKTKFVLFFAFIFLVLALFILKGIKSEFMPKLNEGTILYMPTTFPGISIEQAQKVLSVQNKILKSFPEVLHVYGKA